MSESGLMSGRGGEGASGRYLRSLPERVLRDE